jgi:hypothetical protein
MADIMSLLSSSYRSSALKAAPSNSKYVAVDPKLYEGSWSGKYANNKSFNFTISDVKGYQAKVRYQSDDGTVQYQDVLIKDYAFRIGNTKFTLTAVGKAQIKNVVTDPATGSTYLDTAQAALR